MTPIEFNGSPRPTIGVEWEFALVDKRTRDLSNTAAALFSRMVDDDPSHADKVHKELLRNTVEVVTGVCASTGEAIDDLTHTLRAVRGFADELGVDLFGAGTHPFAEWSSQLLTDGPRYSELIERTQWWGRQMLIWGVHVHVGINHRDKVLPIVSSLLCHYPHLLALSASSPMWAGQVTGYASNRAMMFQQLPTAGLPFHFDTWSQYEEFVDDQKKTGIIDEINEIRWDIRPSPKIGTIEIRICDGTSNLDELGALIAFIHCLVVDLDRRCDAGETLPTMAPWLVQENKWRAARYGLDAEIILDGDCREDLVTRELERCVDQLHPLARELDCATELERVLDIPRNGGAYQRQRETYDRTGSMWKVVDRVVGELKL